VDLAGLEPITLIYEAIMKRAHLMIFSCALVLASVHVAVAGHPQAAAAGGFDAQALDMVVTDSMVLPLIGMSDHIEGRLAFLRVELKITTKELSLWDAFATTIRQNAAQEIAMSTQWSAAIDNVAMPLNLPQRLERHEKHLTAHRDMLQRVTATLLPLYASLSNDQKKSADALVNGVVGL
jgi:hypothetical protein